MYLNRSLVHSESGFTQIMLDKETVGWTAKDVLLVVTMGAFLVLSLSSNLVVITTILATRKLRSVSSIFVVNMAICDLGVSVVSMPLVISSVLNGGWIYSQMACSATGCLFTVFAVGSVLSTAVVSLDRFFAIIYCLQYSTWKTMYYGGSVLVCLWLQACSFGFAPLVGWSDVRYNSNRYMCVITWYDSLSYAILNCILCFLVPLVLMTVCYVKICFVAHAHVRQIEDTTNRIHRTSPESSHISLNGAVAAGAMFSVRRLSMLSFPGSMDEMNNGPSSPIEADYNSGASIINSSSAFRRDIRTIIRLLSLIVLLVVCWAPYLYVNTAEIFHSSIPNSMLTLSTWFVLMMSCINPFSYAISSKRFRFAIRKLQNYKNRKKCAYKKTANHQSSYSLYLKTLRSPSVSSDPGDKGRFIRMRSMDKAIRNITELRPASASAPDMKIVRMPTQYLQVPHNSTFSFCTSTRMPLQYREPDVLPLKDRCTMQGNSRRNTCPVNISEHRGMLEEYVFSENNKARIKIKFDLVPD